MSIPTFDISTVPDRDRERVAGLIPNPAIADAYVHRTIKGWEDFAILDKALEKGRNVMLMGPTGSSKTTVFRAYAAARGLPFVVVESNAAMDYSVVVGRTMPDEAGEVRFIDGDFTLVVRYGGIVLIDEINMAHPRVTAALHGVLSVMSRMSVPEAGEVVHAGHGGHDHITHDDGRVECEGEAQPILFGAAYNPRYQGVVRLNEALNNRFADPIEWDYDRAVEAQLVSSSRLLDMAANVRALDEIRTPCSTNMLQEFEEHVEDFDMEMAEYFFTMHFAPEERAPIARALEANRAAIARELNASVAVTA
jgi:MoxR-like ATPase